MATISIPFLTSQTNYLLGVPVDDFTLLFDTRWNSRDSAWYVDIYEDDGTPVAINVKIVTGVQLGRLSQHDFFTTHKLIAVDTSGQGLDPGFDDLNARVLVVITSSSDV